MNKPLPKKVLTDLCEQLGYEPHTVSRIVIEPFVVTVEFIHPVQTEEPS